MFPTGPQQKSHEHDDLGVSSFVSNGGPGPACPTQLLKRFQALVSRKVVGDDLAQLRSELEAQLPVSTQSKHSTNGGAAGPTAGREPVQGSGTTASRPRSLSGPGRRPQSATLTFKRYRSLTCGNESELKMWESGGKLRPVSAGAALQKGGVGGTWARTRREVIVGGRGHGHFFQKKMIPVPHSGKNAGQMFGRELLFASGQATWCSLWGSCVVSSLMNCIRKTRRVSHELGGQTCEQRPAVHTRDIRAHAGSRVVVKVQFPEVGGCCREGAVPPPHDSPRQVQFRLPTQVQFRLLVKVQFILLPNSTGAVPPPREGAVPPPHTGACPRPRDVRVQFRLSLS